MPKLINQDGLAEGLLNLGHHTATGYLLPWKQHLTNSDGILDLMMVRIESDWVSLAPKMRKPWNATTLESHRFFSETF